MDDDDDEEEDGGKKSKDTHYVRFVCCSGFFVFFFFSIEVKRMDLMLANYCTTGNDCYIGILLLCFSISSNSCSIE